MFTCEGSSCWLGVASGIKQLEAKIAALEMIRALGILVKIERLANSHLNTGDVHIVSRW